MTITCSELDDLLLAADAASMQRAQEHAGHCPACREQLEAWIEISDTAARMQVRWPSDTLWPRIERALAVQRGRSRNVASRWRVAAALLLTAALAAGSWLAIVHSRNAVFDRSLLRAQALEEAERAARMHTIAIERLERLTDSRLEDDPSPLLLAYREKLMLLDDALNECQRNIQQNRQNARLRQQLLAIYTEKQRTLEEVMREESHVTNR